MIVAGRPLVSCVMPTADRPEFVSRAIEQFLAQDYPAKELIILDSSERPERPMVPRDVRIDYHVTPKKYLGILRNQVNSYTRGAVIAHWDDDDLYAPWRLSYQIKELGESLADLCGTRNILYLDSDGHTWEYRGQASNWVHGATLCYRRALWEAHPFPSEPLSPGKPDGSDTAFVGRVYDTNRPLRVHDRHDFYVGTIHPRNVSPKKPGPPLWTHGGSLPDWALERLV